MEKILSKKSALVVALLLAALGLSTAAQTVSTRPYSKTEWVNGVPYQVFNLPSDGDKAKHFIRANKQETEQPKKRLAKEEAQMVNVNIQLVEHDDIVEYPTEIYAIIEKELTNNEMGDLGKLLRTGDNSITAGIYTIWTFFKKLNADRELVNCYVFKESIPVYEDMTLVFDTDEAKNFVQTKVIARDGNEIRMQRIQLNNVGEWEITGGEDIAIGGFMPFFKENLRYSFGGLSCAEYWNDYNFYISDINDITLNLSLFFDKDDVIHTVSFYQKGIHDDIVFENNPNEFIEYEAKYKVTPLGEVSDSPHYPMICNSFYDAQFITMLLRNVTNGSVKYCFGKSEFYPNLPLRVVTGLTDYFRLDENDPEWEWYDAIYNLPIFNIDGELIRMNCGYFSNDISGYDFFHLDGETLFLNHFQYPGHPAFTNPVPHNSPETIGNNCPIMRTNSYVYLDDEFVFINGNTSSLGRCGEKRVSDKQAMTSIVKLNEMNVSEMGGDYILVTQEPNNGTYEVMLTNENVEVDGMPGKNVSQLYVDLTREDKAPPTLTMLHFRDTDGLVTDRFTTSNVGKIELSAEDIYSYPNWEENNIHYSINPLINVEVSYSPYGEDNWNELPVEEDPSLFYLPDMGNFFHGSLEGVTGQAYEGWFDLKVKVTDAAGNWQEQVISPAFRIDNLAYSSVATVGKDNAQEVARYNLAGQRVDANAKGVVIVKMSDGTARKILVP